MEVRAHADSREALLQRALSSWAEPIRYERALCSLMVRRLREYLECWHRRAVRARNAHLPLHSLLKQRIEQRRLELSAQHSPHTRTPRNIDAISANHRNDAHSHHTPGSASPTRATAGITSPPTNRHRYRDCSHSPTASPSSESRANNESCSTSRKKVRRKLMTPSTQQKNWRSDDSEYADATMSFASKSVREAETQTDCNNEQLSGDFTSLGRELQAQAELGIQWPDDEAVEDDDFLSNERLEERGCVSCGTRRKESADALSDAEREAKGSERQDELVQKALVLGYWQCERQFKHEQAEWFYCTLSARELRRTVLAWHTMARSGGGGEGDGSLDAGDADPEAQSASERSNGRRRRRKAGALTVIARGVRKRWLMRKCLFGWAGWPSQFALGAERRLEGDAFGVEGFVVEE